MNARGTTPARAHTNRVTSSPAALAFRSGGHHPGSHPNITARMQRTLSPDRSPRAGTEPSTTIPDDGSDEEQTSVAPSITPSLKDRSSASAGHLRQSMNELKELINSINKDGINEEDTFDEDYYRLITKDIDEKLAEYYDGLKSLRESQARYDSATIAGIIIYVTGKYDGIVTNAENIRRRADIAYLPGGINTDSMDLHPPKAEARTDDARQ